MHATKETVVGATLDGKGLAAVQARLAKTTEAFAGGGEGAPQASPQEYACFYAWINYVKEYVEAVGSSIKGDLKAVLGLGDSPNHRALLALLVCQSDVVANRLGGGSKGETLKSQELFTSILTKDITADWVERTSDCIEKYRKAWDERMENKRDLLKDRFMSSRFFACLTSTDIAVLNDDSEQAAPSEKGDLPRFKVQVALAAFINSLDEEERPSFF